MSIIQVLFFGFRRSKPGTEKTVEWTEVWHLHHIPVNVTLVFTMADVWVYSPGSGWNCKLISYWILSDRDIIVSFFFWELDFNPEMLHAVI